MAAKRRKWCKSCNQYVLAEEKKPTETALAGWSIATIFSMGLLLPAFAAWGLTQMGWLCPNCGRRV